MTLSETKATADAAPAAGASSHREDALPGVQFRAFFAELVRARAAAQASSADDAPAVAQTLSRQLQQVIELHTLEMRRSGGRSIMDTEVQARFLKAALADEIMLNLDWHGRGAWRHVLLEAQLFRSSIAGDKVFDDIERMLREREPAQRTAARLYLELLALGFQGRWRGSGELHRLAQYRRELYRFASQREPDLGQPGRVLMPQTYASTIGHLARRRMPRLSRWGVGLTLAALLLLGLSQLIWLWRSWPLREALGAVLAGMGAGPSNVG